MTRFEKIPQHVAIIMDGNGRWAKAHGKERVYGHMHGVESVRRVIKACPKYGIKYLTLYTFSTENWGRPSDEVNALMELMCSSIEGETPELCKQGVAVKILGDRSALSDKVNGSIDYIESQTANGQTLTLMLAFNYSSRSEIVRAVQNIAQKVKNGELNATEISEQMITDNLYTVGVPDPDLVIRTSGECRLSNFFMLQSAYSELYFMDVLWPDFDEAALVDAIEVYNKRDRRFGLVKNEE
ncbi:MAG: isoprenyl transferase [Rikenellaceae bacterium]|nr:isoprenyl transferase [Rikenellaceae bacterium]